MIEARMRAEDANREKSNFLVSVSHELRTPLNSIIDFADVLREKSFGPLITGRRNTLTIFLLAESTF
jgi:signal transduction histidine kinase